MNATLGRWVLALAIAAPAFAITTATVTAPTADDDKRRVDSVSVAGKVENWQMVDPSHVIIDVGKQQNYLLTLEQPCHHLGFAQHVGITRSGDTVYAGFDSVTADGWRCRIDRIHAID